VLWRVMDGKQRLVSSPGVAVTCCFTSLYSIAH
jgi:hypothetical protein